YAVGLRHSMERRVGDRRTYTRGTPDRRRYERRRARLRSLLFTSLALAVPHHLKHTPLPGPVSGPRVSTAIHSIVAVPPEQAYEGLIREAAARYRLDPSLIRSVMAAESAFDPSSASSIRSIRARTSWLVRSCCVSCSISITATSRSRSRATTPARPRWRITEASCRRSLKQRGM